MDPKELRGLMEAYQQVNAPQEEIDEASYSAKAARAGKDIGKPGKAFSKIAASAAKRYGSEERGKKVAGAVLAKLRKEEIEILEDVIDENRMASRMEKMPSAPAKVGKATHSIKDLAPSKAPSPEEKAKARKALGLGEAVDLFDTVLEFLQVEGYAETLEEAEWLMANVIDEEAIDIILDEVTSADYMSLAKTKKPRSAASIQARAHASRLNKPEKETGKKSSRPSSPLRSKMTQDTRDAGRLAAEYGSYDEPGYGSSSKGSLPKGKKLARQKATGVSEAQEARNNPEKYEREQSKKSAPVRGERTPMPPRGDKRREDFEKWYAANGPK